MPSLKEGLEEFKTIFDSGVFPFSVSRDAVAGVHCATAEPQKLLVSSTPWRKWDWAPNCAVPQSVQSGSYRSELSTVQGRAK